MRKILALTAVAMLPIAFAACGDDDDDNGGTTPAGDTGTGDITVPAVATTVPTT